MPKLIRDRLLDALDDPELNTRKIAAGTVITGEDIGITEKAIQALIANPGRVPELRTLEALARALGDKVESYYEWPIAKARADAAARPEAGRRRVTDAARKAAARKAGRRRPGSPPKPQEGPDEKSGSGRAA